MAFAVTNIAQATNTTGATRTITVPVGGVPSGSLIVIIASDASNAAANGGSVADAGSNTYTFRIGDNPNGATANGLGAIFTAPCATPLTSGQLITYTKAVSGSGASVQGCYVTGHDTTTPVDAGASTTATGSGTAASVTSGTPSVANSLFVAAVVITATGATVNGRASWTLILSNTGTRETESDYLVGSGTSTQTFDPTFNTTKLWASLMLVISPASGGGTAALRRNSSLNGLGASGPFFHNPLAA